MEGVDTEIQCIVVDSKMVEGRSTLVGAVDGNMVD